MCGWGPLLLTVFADAERYQNLKEELLRLTTRDTALITPADQSSVYIHTRCITASSLEPRSKSGQTKFGTLPDTQYDTRCVA
jgi:hypothetical protein